ncbi:MAG: hypothetical protein B7Y50_01675 [Hydrogenophilales bacterium 28-61-11]|nr:MAG: hypothetical protein B7Y50_01675 [Hydrogenophilales bacterium 28-61-11]OYZ57390.1 MAG: hypothetical protein B7Y21_07750 [Hydrogenophilales bacterium 16-61-112]OZA49270.1 MAG: hypothetical protein B7X81_02725 [Hydrogenophilales bacterium 17-61-76]
MPGMMTKEPSFWWPVPLAALLWLALLWGVGFYMKSPPIAPPPAAIDARLVELVDAQEAPKAAPIAAVKPQPQAKPRPKLRAPRLTPPSPKPPQPEPAPPAPPEPVSRPALPLDLDRPVESAPTDMMSYINAQRARRQAEETDAGSSARQASADEIRMANIRRNLQPAGTNGIFQILDIQPRTARFSFRSWTTIASNPQRETISVSAGPDGDIQLAIIRRMIGLIRGYFKGDFNWESQRLGQVVVLSAREEDTAELEDFLKREFFGVGVKNRAH